MDWALEFSPGRKPPPRKGRRAGATGNSTIGSISISPDHEDGTSGDFLNSPESGSMDFPGPTAPPRSRRTGGWADEAIKSGKRRSTSNLIEQERFRGPDKSKGDSDEDVPDIPDLEDMQDEDLAGQVAHAPMTAVNRVATYKALDSELFKHAAFATLDDVNLRLLTKCLNLETEVKEADAIWTWDLLFTDVASELHLEWENSVTSADKDTLNITVKS